MKHEPSDHQPELPAAVIGCALIVAAVFFVASLADEKNAHDGWVHRYQTLITGFFAVGAAYLTVWQMRKTDAESERRHQELVRLQVRSDKLKIERMLIPQLSQLRVHYKKLRDADTAAVNIYAIEGEDEEAHRTMLRLADLLIDVKGDCFAVQEIIDRHHWIAAGDLFGGALRYHEEHLREALSDAPRLFHRLKDYTSEQVEPHYKREPWRMYSELRERREAILGTAAKVSGIRNSLERLFPHLYDLADLYQVKL